MCPQAETHTGPWRAQRPVLSQAGEPTFSLSNSVSSPSHLDLRSKQILILMEFALAIKICTAFNRRKGIKCECDGLICTVAIRRTSVVLRSACLPTLCETAQRLGSLDPWDPPPEHADGILSFGLLHSLLQPFNRSCLFFFFFGLVSCLPFSSPFPHFPMLFFCVLGVCF